MDSFMVGAINEAAGASVVRKCVFPAPYVETALKNVGPEHIMPPLCLYKYVTDQTVYSLENCLRFTGSHIFQF